jgi:2-iminobutanoate/2-iminopropanoate deaminase
MSGDVVTTTHAPEAIGPYSQAVSAGGVVYCSGQIALDPSSGELVGDSVAEQARQCLENLSTVAQAAGASLADAVRVTVYLTDMGDFGEFNDVYSGFFETAPPARSTVAVSGLPKGARLEVDCIAAP